MQQLDVRLDMIAAPWDDLPPDTPGGSVERIGLVPNGTASGNPSVGIAIRMPDGTWVVGETTWALLDGATRAFRGATDGR